MSIIHTKNALASGGLQGLQAAQRDWSPYLVHFTSWSAMAPLRALATKTSSPNQVATDLAAADVASFQVVQLIASSQSLLARSPSGKHRIPDCVCLSECNLAGLISHSERYGRFGFVFDKTALYAAGGRPCMYVDAGMYREIAKLGKTAAAGSRRNRLFGLANVYRPPQVSGRTQDYTHEREWRVFSNVDFTVTAPKLLLAPLAYVPQIAALPGLAGIPVIPTDTLYEWGA